MAFRRIEKRIENANTYHFIKGGNKKDKIIYRQKCHNKRVKIGTSSRKLMPYLVLTQDGNIYMVYSKFHIFKGTIKRNRHDCQFYKFFKEYEAYLKQKGGTSEI
jgi:hypothetical protein